MAKDTLFLPDIRTSDIVEGHMYNYRIGNITDQDILNQVFSFCNDTHNEDELLNHVKITLSALFSLHECSLFHAPKDLDDSIWNRILFEYHKCIRMSNIVFPERPVVGPQYKTTSYLDEVDSTFFNGINPDKRLTKFLPFFFGIKYTAGEQNYFYGWKPSQNPKNIMIEHRKLYDILFSYCYKNGNLRCDGEDTKKILGNLAKPSIFRFEERAVGNYCKAFDHIRKELIYRIAGSDSWAKLRDAMFVERNISQMRNISFSIIEQLMNPKYYSILPIKRLNKETFDEKKYHELLYDFIIKKCKKREVITIKENGKKDKFVSPINMYIKDDTNAVLYYAYAFFCNLKTSDYIQEVKKLLGEGGTELDKILDLSEQYKSNRNLLMLGRFYWETVADEIADDLADIMREYTDIPYEGLDEFIYKTWNNLIPIICIDDFEIGKGKKFCDNHKERMIEFLYLFKAINRKKNEEYISVIHLLDLLHLYVRLKLGHISIPTSSTGYNKIRPTKPVKIDNAMKLLEDEWNKRSMNQTVQDRLYMKNVIIETWLSVVMYMAINGIDRALFMKRLDATISLFQTLLQLIPFITRKNDRDVDYETIIYDLLGISKQINGHIR